MRTARSLKWLLSLLPLVTVLLVVRGQAASDSPLLVAARNGDLVGVRAQIARRVDVNAPASDGSTPLLWAAYHSDLDMTRALLAA
jgi:ankyrin repeat protein